jgi:hypothetical protein
LFSQQLPLLCVAAAGTVAMGAMLVVTLMGKEMPYVYPLTVATSIGAMATRLTPGFSHLRGALPEPTVAGAPASPRR